MINVDLIVINLKLSLQSIFILLVGVSNIYTHLTNNFFILTYYNLVFCVYL